MNNYNKNNHFLQAAWVGRHFNNVSFMEKFIPKDLQQSIRGRKLKVNVFLFETFLKNESDWIDFDDLNKKYIRKDLPAENFFLSNYKISDNMDEEFAESCESFLKNVGDISLAYDSYLMLKKECGDYTLINLTTNEQDFYIDALVSGLKGFIALHTVRCNFNVLSSIKKTQAFAENKDIKFFMTQKQFLEFAKFCKELKRDSDFHRKINLKVIDIEIKNRFSVLRSQMEYFNVFEVFFRTDNQLNVLPYNVLSEMPFMSTMTFNKYQKKELLELFITFLGKKENKRFLDSLKKEFGENFMESMSFNNQCLNFLDHFVGGVLTKNYFIVFYRDNNNLSNIMAKFIYEIYPFFVASNYSSTIIVPDIEGFKVVYNFMRQNSFGTFKNDMLENNTLLKQFYNKKNY